MKQIYPHPPVTVRVHSEDQLDEVPIWNAILPRYRDDQNPDWLPDDYTIDSVMTMNTVMREEDELVIQGQMFEDKESCELRIHKKNLDLVGDPEFEEIPTADDY